ncbi:MAG: hypothetical protein ACK56F_11885, partial [bacterium]
GFWVIDLCNDRSVQILANAPLEVYKRFTREQIERAKGVRKLHVTLGHPSDKVLCSILDGNVILNCPYTSTDVRNAEAILGECLACIAGKIVEAPGPTSESAPATAIGDNVSGDLLKLDEASLGRVTQILILIDEYSNYGLVIGLKRKTEACITAAVASANAYYKRYGHSIKRFTPDAEPNFVATVATLGEHGILVDPTIPGRHSR